MRPEQFWDFTLRNIKKVQIYYYYFFLIKYRYFFGKFQIQGVQIQ